MARQLLLALPGLVCLITGTCGIICKPGRRLPHPTDLSSFYLCGKDSNPYSFTCSEGLIFNPKTRTCGGLDHDISNKENPNNDLGKIVGEEIGHKINEKVEEEENEPKEKTISKESTSTIDNHSAESVKREGQDEMFEKDHPDSAEKNGKRDAGEYTSDETPYDAKLKLNRLNYKPFVNKPFRLGDMYGYGEVSGGNDPSSLASTDKYDVIKVKEHKETIKQAYETVRGFVKQSA